MDQPRISDEPVDQQPDGPSQESKRKRPGKRWIALPCIAAALLAIAVSVLPPDSTGAPSAAPSSSTLSAVATPPAAVTSGTPTVTPGMTAAKPSAPAAPTADPGPAASQPVGLSFAAAGIDMAVLPLTPSEADLESQSLVPPLTLDAYWLTPYGSPGAGSQNTTYIAGHSWDGREAPFNRLSNEALLGTEFALTTETGTITYIVDQVITHDKDTLKDSEIWNIVPNRVVLISCYTEDPWGKNVVVTAMPKAA